MALMKDIKDAIGKNDLLIHQLPVGDPLEYMFF